MPEWLVSVLIVGAAVTLWVLADFLPGPFQPRVESDGVRVRLLGFVPLLHIPFDQIADIQTKSWKQVFHDGELTAGWRIGVRVFRKPVVITRVNRSTVL